MEQKITKISYANDVTLITPVSYTHLCVQA